MFDPTKLRWAPPAQTLPTTHNMSVGNENLTFSDDEDVVLVMPATVKTSQTVVLGGRHVRVIGGAFVAGSGAGGSNSLFFRDQTGSVFVEGVSFDNTASPVRDCIWVGGTFDPLRRPDVYVQNCTMVGIDGVNEGVHGDMVQIGSFPIGEIRIDCVDGVTEYQGIMANSAADRPRDFIDISRVTIDASAAPSFGLVFYDSATGDTRGDVVMRDVWMASNPDGFDPSIKPFPSTTSPSGAPIGSVVGPLTQTFNMPFGRGYFHSAARSALTIGTPGLSYTSPGYNDPDDQPVFVSVSVDGGGMKPRLLHHFMSAQPDGVVTWPAVGGAVSMTWSDGACSYSGTITVPVEKLAGGQGPMSLTFVDGLLTAAT